MARCSGGPGRKGKQRSGRLHLNGDENDCAKHQSDNFSFMSTISRVATRNQRLPRGLAPITIGGPGRFGGEEGDGTETERATSLPSTIPDTIARSHSLGSTTSHLEIARQRSRSLPNDREEGVAIVLEGREVNDSRSPILSWIAGMVLVTIVAYVYYRWFYRAEFRYQNELLRELYGLERSREFWF